MRIALCGSMAFAKKMLQIKKQLEKKNHEVVVPANISDYASGIIKHEDKWQKIKSDVIRNYFEEIKKTDAILVLNYDKNEIKNYVGGNGLIEIAFAHVLRKKIFLLHPIPETAYSDEIKSMKPTILHNNLEKIN